MPRQALPLTLPPPPPPLMLSPPAVTSSAQVSTTTDPSGVPRKPNGTMPVCCCIALSAKLRLLGVPFAVNGCIWAPATQTCQGHRLEGASSDVLQGGLRAGGVCSKQAWPLDIWIQNSVRTPHLGDGPGSGGSAAAA